MGVRVHDEINWKKSGKGKLTNADGKTGEKGADGVWGRISAWCDDSGPLDGGKTAGIALLADPGNPYPSSFAGTLAATVCWRLTRSAAKSRASLP